MPQSTSTTQPQPSPATQPWPDGVIARYLTVAGATADVRSNGRSYICRGCGEGMTDLGERRIRELAQGHAEKCRALPRPEAGR